MDGVFGLDSRGVVGIRLGRRGGRVLVKFFVASVLSQRFVGCWFVFDVLL